MTAPVNDGKRENWLFGWVLVVLISGLGGCDRGPKSGAGLVLPEGNAQAGEAAFIQLNCNDCHLILGRPDLSTQLEPLMAVPIGGKTTRIATYGELVTSIVNPSHKISARYIGDAGSSQDASPMRNYNDIMTVSTLNNLVTFLQDQYELVRYSRPPYAPYYD